MVLSFCDPVNRECFFKYYSVFLTISSFVLPYIDYYSRVKFILLTAITTYFLVWQYNKRKSSINLKINNTDFEIKFGDIFEEKECLKVIPFNEYFDTHVGDGIISKYTLNGKFINKYYKDNISELDKEILNSLKEQNCIPKTKFEERVLDKKDVYELGTIACVDNQYLLSCLTHFDENNNAHIGIEEYISFLGNFWNEIYKLYNGANVTLPILGDGITRFKIFGCETHVDSQKLIEMIIWTYKLSNIKLNSKITIIIHKKNKNNINLLDLKRKSS